MGSNTASGPPMGHLSWVYRWCNLIKWHIMGYVSNKYDSWVWRWGTIQPLAPFMHLFKSDPFIENPIPIPLVLNTPEIVPNMKFHPTKPRFMVGCKITEPSNLACVSIDCCLSSSFLDVVWGNWKGMRSPSRRTRPKLLRIPQLHQVWIFLSQLLEEVIGFSFASSSHQRLHRRVGSKKHNSVVLRTVVGSEKSWHQ